MSETLTPPVHGADDRAILIKEFNGSWIPLAIYTVVLGVITFATIFLTPETKARDLTRILDALHERRQEAVSA